VIRRQWAALVGLAAVLAVAGLAGAPPAVAHSGSRAELYLADLRLEPARPGEWTIHAFLTDRDSGKALPGFDVQVTGLSPTGQRFGPVKLDDPGLRGDYSATVTPEPGPWSITVDAKGFQGGAEGIPLLQRVDVHLTPGASATAPSAASRQRSSGGPDPIRWAVPAVTVVVIGVLALGATRRRSVEATG
jgi:hypothetical protein